MNIDVKISFWTAVVKYDIDDNRTRATEVQSFTDYSKAEAFVNKIAEGFARENNVPVYWHDWSETEPTQFMPYGMKADKVDFNNDAVLVETIDGDLLLARIVYGCL